MNSSRMLRGTSAPGESVHDTSAAISSVPTGRILAVIVKRSVKSSTTPTDTVTLSVATAEPRRMDHGAHLDRPPIDARAQIEERIEREPEESLGGGVGQETFLVDVLGDNGESEEDGPAADDRRGHRLEPTERRAGR